jgi:hypothetical protein
MVGSLNGMYYQKRKELPTPSGVSALVKGAVTLERDRVERADGIGSDAGSLRGGRCWQHGRTRG